MRLTAIRASMATTLLIATPLLAHEVEESAEQKAEQHTAQETASQSEQPTDQQAEGTAKRNNARNRGPSGRRKSLHVGELAPTFSLKSLDGKETFDLRAHRGKRPVLLLFGSYT